MGKSLDMILTAAAVIVGIMLLTGHGDFFMKGGDAERRKKDYDEKKMTKASGITLILIGAATGIDSFTTGMGAKLAYLGVLIVVFGGFIYYLRTKCKK